MAAKKKWSSRELEHQFKTGLFERMVMQPAKVSAVLRQSHPAALNAQEIIAPSQRINTARAPVRQCDRDFCA